MYIIDLDTIISEQFAWYVLHLVCNNMCSLLFENQVKVIIYKIKAEKNNFQHWSFRLEQALLSENKLKIYVAKPRLVQF